MTDDPKTILHTVLRSQRDSLRLKLEGLSERDARLPRTPTGTNLLGLYKHVGSCELGYFGETFGRPSDLPLPWDAPGGCRSRTTPTSSRPRTSRWPR